MSRLYREVFLKTTNVSNILYVPPEFKNTVSNINLKSYIKSDDCDLQAYSKHFYKYKDYFLFKYLYHIYPIKVPMYLMNIIDKKNIYY
jgi:hypothetical protein